MPVIVFKDELSLMYYSFTHWSTVFFGRPDDWAISHNDWHLSVSQSQALLA